MQLRTILFTLPLFAIGLCAQERTYAPASDDASAIMSALIRNIEHGDSRAVTRFWKQVHRSGAPLIEPVAGDDRFSLVTFLYEGNAQTQNVVLFDGVAGFDARDRMILLRSSNVWYKTYRVRNDARFAYNLSVNDSLQPFSEVKGSEAMKARLASFQPDPLNPRRCPTTFGAYGTFSSYLSLPKAPPLLWAKPAQRIPHGHTVQTTLRSATLGEDKKLYVYTPANFALTTQAYPLLVSFDGDRNVEWIPKLLDVLIAQKTIPPMIAVMTDDSVPQLRQTELPCNPRYAQFLATELVPYAREHLHAGSSSERTLIAGSSYGGLAAVYAALSYPAVFGNVISLSGSFWWKPEGDKSLTGFLIRQAETTPKLPLRFYLEVGLMEDEKVQIQTNRQMRDVLAVKGYPIGYHEFNGGHSFLTWSSGLVSGLASLLQ